MIPVARMAAGGSWTGDAWWVCRTGEPSEVPVMVGSFSSGVELIARWEPNAASTQFQHPLK
jgi:hypothetical protein